MVSETSFGSRILDMLPTLVGRLPAALQFQVSLNQEGCTSLATWHVQIPGKIITELSVCCSTVKRLEETLRAPTWLRGIDADVQSANVGTHSARVLW